MFTIKPLPYEYNALEPYIDEETMRVHHNGHYATYAKNLNDILDNNPKFLEMDISEMLTSINQVPPEIRQKVINNGGGVYNHELFWEIMAPKVKGEPSSKVLEEIEKNFGSFNEFKDKFTSAAISVFGSGWTWLVLDNGKLSIMTTSNQNSPITEGKIPIIGLDVWEHAYYLLYTNRRKDYIENWWNVVNWKEVERRLNQALGIKQSQASQKLF